jgi:hypothetical protein
MKKFILCVAAAMSLLGGVKLQAYIERKPGSAVIELTPLVTSSATFISNFPSETPVPAPAPLGTMVNLGENFVAVLKVLTAPTPANGQFLSVLFQSSADDGQTWNDFAHIQVSGTTTGTYYVPVSTIAPASTSASPIMSGGLFGNILTSNTCVQGAIGNRVRARYYTWFGAGGVTGVYTFQAYLWKR